MRAFGLLTVLLVAPPAGSPAQSPPCANLTPIEDEELGYRPRGNRCEGVFERDVGIGVEPEFELVSLTAGRIEFTWSESTVLEVKPAAEVSEAIQARGRAIPRGTQYQMDAVLEPASTLTWPIGDVLFDIGLGPGQLGVVGWLPGRRREVLVPLRVIEAGALFAAETRTLASLQANVPYGYLRWRILELDHRDRCVEQGDWIRPTKRSRDLDELLEIPLPEEPARLCLEVTAKAKEGEGKDLWTELRVTR